MYLFTSNYRNFSGVNSVQISNTKPDWHTVTRSIPEFYPEAEFVWKWNTLKKLPENNEERKRFWEEVFVPEYLTKLNALGIERALSLVREGDVLLCWCGKECHRHILASWFGSYGVVVKEI